MMLLLFTIKHSLEPFQGFKQGLAGFGFISGFVLLRDNGKKRINNGEAVVFVLTVLLLI